jgi:hypothetical protein
LWHERLSTTEDTEDTGEPRHTPCSLCPLWLKFSRADDRALIPVICCEPQEDFP